MDYKKDTEFGYYTPYGNFSKIPGEVSREKFKRIRM